jgi:hypothetical protein
VVAQEEKYWIVDFDLDFNKWMKRSTFSSFFGVIKICDKNMWQTSGFLMHLSNISQNVRFFLSNTKSSWIFWKDIIYETINNFAKEYKSDFEFINMKNKIFY